METVQTIPDISRIIPPRLRRSGGNRSERALLLRGHPGRDGFLFHDGHNQPVHQAFPGILGLLEARHVIERWKPAIGHWMDERGHFFDHILREHEGQAYFQHVRREIDEIRHFDTSERDKSRFLFQYLKVLAGELERAELRSSRRSPRPWRLPLRGRGNRVPRDLSLNGDWTAHYREAPGRFAQREVQLPVNWELLPGIENYAGSMRFTKVLDLPASMAGRCLLLRFAGVDYFADIWVNGHHAGGHEGFFGPFELDIGPFVRHGERNVVRLTVTSPNDPAGAGVSVASGWDDFDPAASFPNRKTLVKGTLGHHDAKRGGAWSSMTSQDGNTGGVWNDVQLKVRDKVRIDPGLRVTTLATAPTGTATSGASIRVAFTAVNTTDRHCDSTVRIRVRPANFKGRSHQLVRRLVLSPGANQVELEEHLDGAQPWQPWDRGVPHLYRMSVALESPDGLQDRVVVETGFRVLAVTPDGESPGPNGALVLNGRPVFVRGTNLLPTYWLSEYDTERVERDFGMLRDAGFNAIMVHTLVGPRHLYECANRYGFLVMQMFPLQWSYDQSPEFVSRAAQQVREMASLLYNDPSVVSYEVHNEPDMRTSHDLDNRWFDFELQAVLRQADPSRWVTTFSSGNHAYPGQFYPLRDDNSFDTLPARFEEEEVHGRRISRHRNLPTEFGIQALPHLALLEQLFAEDRVDKVLRRIRTDPAWVAAGGESFLDAQRTLAETKALLGGGDWDQVLAAVDWRHLWKLGDELTERIAELDRSPTPSDEAAQREGVSIRLMALLLEILHYGAFKGENLWFGEWRPASTLAELVSSSQDRQYRLHKHAIEAYLNAGATGPIVGYFSFMFRDADWQAPTWGIVDAAWVPKKAYRAYLESNQPVRVTLPHALRRPVKLPGDAWFGALPGDEGNGTSRPWADAEIIVSNDTEQTFRDAQVDVWLERDDGTAVPLVDRDGTQLARYRLPVDLAPASGFSYFDRVPSRALHSAPSQWIVPEEMAPGSYQLKARISTSTGTTLSTNSYDFLVPDTRFPELASLTDEEVTSLLVGADVQGFHYWHGGAAVYPADPGVRGFLQGLAEARRRGYDLYETIQGEHFFNHLLNELPAVPGSGFVIEDLWLIRSEILSPREKARVLVRYLELLELRAESRMAHGRGNGRSPVLPPSPLDADVQPMPGGPISPPVGRDVASTAGSLPNLRPVLPGRRARTTRRKS
ncbi:MAG: hypothetical protein KY452_03135 [Actinobacteria bacterium]|nr:hypothetical protein [Actinomycetota bacterium]